MAKPLRGADRFEARERLRRKLFVLQGGLCHICGKLMHMERQRKRGNFSINRQFATFDHLTPASKGGSSNQANLKLAHMGCNSARGSKPIAATSATALTRGSNESS